MSFKCQYCGNPQPSGTSPIRRVAETRPNEHSRGHQIVKEMNLCVSCDPKITDALERAQEARTQLVASLERSELLVSLGESMRVK